MALSIMANGITTLSIIANSITTLSTMPLGITTLRTTIKMCHIAEHNAECHKDNHYADCCLAEWRGTFKGAIYTFLFSSLMRFKTF